MGAILKIEHLSKSFGGLKAVSDFSMDVEQASIHSIGEPTVLSGEKRALVLVDSFPSSVTDYRLYFFRFCVLKPIFVTGV